MSDHIFEIKMDPLPLTLVDMSTVAKAVTNSYQNFPIALLNDHVIRMSIMTDPFYWHFHPNSDETFLVVEGTIYIDLDDRTVELSAGQLFTIPMNVNHRTRPKTPRSVNLTFESQKMETVKTGI
jgi:mannose-6-phosphate isomerase-like protein (cupin superfamily)